MGIVLINLTVFDDDTADDEEGIPGMEIYLLEYLILLLD